MKKKLQVFISSTFTDLQVERQVAVEAVLNAGHIPAGMELFKAGNETQWETITRWIDDSDVYCLILGGRYGSIEPTSGKSYTHLEYEYAAAKGMPLFAVVIEENALEEKVKKSGFTVMETERPEQYKEFRKQVLSKTSKFFTDYRDITLAVVTTLNEFEQLYDLAGWISGREISQTHFEETSIELTKLSRENARLRLQLESERADSQKYMFSSGFTYEQIKKALSKIKIPFSKNLLEPGDNPKVQYSALRHFLAGSGSLATGVSNSTQATDVETFLFYSVAPHLMKFNLVEYAKVPSNVHWRRIQTSKDGFQFLAMYELEQSTANQA